ncbi:MAG TPA: 2Fe-2S iron-sulfur cluster-binding protein [Rhodocyclaceae bacterium]
MTRMLSLSRAARLVGVTRVALQKKISEGLLDAFEGQVAEESLLQAYPHVSIEDDSRIEQLVPTRAQIRSARATERMPSREVLAARLAALGNDLSDAKASAARYRKVVDALDERLRQWDSGSEELQAAALSLRAWLHETMQTTMDPVGLRNLTIRDSFLRITSSQIRLEPSDHEFFLDGTDTILEAALRAGISPNYGCSNGSCGRCKARVVSGQIMQTRPHEFALSEEERASGYALMCSNTAVSDMVIEAGEATSASDIPVQRITAQAKTLSPLGDGMMLLQLKTPANTRLRFLAGQNAVLHIGESLTAELAIAGCPCDDGNLPFHVPKLVGNHFSEYVWNRLRVGDSITVEGPFGDFALRTDPAQKLVFIVFGNSFAQMKGLMEHALTLDKVGSMHMYWVVWHEPDLYFANWPRAMAESLDNFRYTPLASKTNLETAGGQRLRLLGALLDRIRQDHGDLAAADVYVTGSESMVGAARAWLLDRGVPDANVRSGICG